MTLREYLKANMFDGDEGGRLTMDTTVLLDLVSELAAHWFIAVSGAQDIIEEYYGEAGVS